MAEILKVKFGTGDKIKPGEDARHKLTLTYAACVHLFISFSITSVVYSNA